MYQIYVRRGDLIMDFYCAIVFATILLLIITVCSVVTNQLSTKQSKVHTTISCLLIGIATICEFVGVRTNGAPEYLIFLHIMAKLIEFSVTPFIGIMVAMSFGTVKRPLIAFCTAGVHAVFQWIAICFQWVFSVDSQNVYHREKLYFVYVTAFIMSVVYGIVCVVRKSLGYQLGFDISTVFTLVLLTYGIIIQFIYSNIRIDFFCVAVCNMIFCDFHYKLMLSVDELTGLLNRRCYDSSMGNIGARAVIIILDVNNFKSVNDRYGHNAGDICLEKISNEIKTVYGKSGLCYRIGGDEFCVILRKNMDKLEDMNAQFKLHIAELNKKFEMIPDVALGYAYYDANLDYIQNVVKEADEMMYTNKKSKRQA